MVQVNKEEFAEFEWDEWNIDKNVKKHGISPNEAEEIFLDEKLRIVKDVRHSQNEERFIAIGKNKKQLVLFVIFTLRKDKIRIISVRITNKKERSRYEKT
jgi:uncharacterized protein